jgi:hypothetical protein
VSNDNYNAPVTPERLEFLKQRTMDQQERFRRYWNGTLDSMDLSGLADELEWLAESYRAARDKSVDDHQNGVRLHIVTARPLTDRIHWDDGQVRGTYKYYAKTEDEALDKFHEEIPVKVLEDFEITAVEYKPEMPTGRGDC